MGQRELLLVGDLLQGVVVERGIWYSVHWSPGSIYLHLGALISGKEFPLIYTVTGCIKIHIIQRGDARCVINLYCALINFFFGVGRIF